MSGGLAPRDSAALSGPAGRQPTRRPRPELQTRRLVVAAGGAAALFGLVTGLTAAGALGGLDRAAFDALALQASSPGEQVLRGLAWLMSAEGSALCLLLMVAAAGAVRRLRPLAAVTAAGLAAGGAIELLLKMVLAQSGPSGYAGVSDASILTIHPPYSFPSGHAVRVVLLVTASVLCIPRQHRRSALAVAVPFALLVLYSRMALGGHWLSDVVGGIALGAVAVPALLAADASWGSPRPRWVHSSSR